MAGFGFSEMLVVLVIVLVIFGPSKLPALGEGLGKAISGFKKGMNDGVKEASSDKAIEKKTEA